MNYLNEDDGVSGLYEDLDGNLYEWVEGYEKVDGVDEWGEVGACAHCMSDSQRDLNGLGALYAAPDGTMYQVQGLSEEEAEAASSPAASESPATEDAEQTRAMPPGRPGQIRVGPGGHRYRWVRGVNAQGKPIGFWRRMRPVAGPMRGPVRGGAMRSGPGRGGPARSGPGRGRPVPSRRGRPPGKGGFMRKLLPIAKLATRLIPIPGAGAVARAGLTVASKLMKPRGVADDGLGALYAAEDGTVYQMQGFAADELHAVSGVEPIDGYAGDETIADDVEGTPDFDGTHGMDGFAAPSQSTPGEAPNILSADDLSADDAVMSGADPSAIEGYVREQPPRTRWFTAPTETPALWKPFW